MSAAAGAYKLDKAELAAIKKIGERVWPVDELGISANTLRGLDQYGLLEARAVIMQPTFRPDRSLDRTTPSPHRWYSPIRQRDIGGAWDAIMPPRERGTWEHPHEVRLSDAGLADLGRRARSKKTRRGETKAAARRPDSEFQPALWFPQKMRGRLRMAVLKTRKTKRVEKREIDGVTCYSVSDAQRWWARDFPKDE